MAEPTSSYFVSFYEPRYLFESKSQVWGGRVPDFNPELAARIVKDKDFTDVVVLLEGEWGAGYKKAYEEKGMRAHHCPIQDYGAPSLQQLNEWIPQILKLVKTENNKILIHCQGGCGRTGTFAACVLAALEKCTGEQAIREIRERNPEAIEARSQEAIIKEYAQAILNQK